MNYCKFKIKFLNLRLEEIYLILKEYFKISLAYYLTKQ